MCIASAGWPKAGWTIAAIACLTVVLPGCTSDVSRSADLTAEVLPEATTAAAPACDLSTITVPADTTLVSARKISEPVPYCRIDGYVTTYDPGPNKVNFMVSLPDDHNGRYLFTVQGGAAGFVPAPRGDHLEKGYAIASTDKGVVTTHILDFSFQSDPAMRLDWAHRGTHVAAVATQAVAKDFYNVDRLYRYVMGCSGGGDGTLTEAEMYPQDFDTFIPGACNTDYPWGTALLWSAIANRVNTVPGSWVSQEDYDKIHQTLLAEYDAADSAVDGLIWDPRVIKLERASFSYLTDAQYGTLQLIQDGVRDENGNWLAPGMWFGNPKEFPSFLTGKTPPPWETQIQQPSGFVVSDTSSKAMYGQEFSYLTDVDFSNPAEVKKFAGEPTKFDHRRLSAMRDSGAKMIMWVGAAEEAVSPQQFVGYADRVAETFGEDSKDFFRIFVVPGLHHCSRGEGAPTDHVQMMLEAAQAWVEEGKAPDYVVVGNTDDSARQYELQSMNPEVMPRGRGFSDMSPAGEPSDARTYLLCALPSRAVFAGGVSNPEDLDVNDSGNWSCKR
jgi:feruloyl esterase